MSSANCQAAGSESLLRSFSATLGFLCCLLFLPPTTAFVQSSATSISFQGVLNGANGQPLTNGNYNLTFRPYTNATTTFVLGVTNVNNVTLSGGVASTAIPVEPAWFDGQTRYFGISVNGGVSHANQGERKGLVLSIVWTDPFSSSSSQAVGQESFGPYLRAILDRPLFGSAALRTLPGHIRAVQTPAEKQVRDLAHLRVSVS